MNYIEYFKTHSEPLETADNWWCYYTETDGYIAIPYGIIMNSIVSRPTKDDYDSYLGFSLGTYITSKDALNERKHYKVLEDMYGKDVAYNITSEMIYSKMIFTETPSLYILCQAKLQADILKNGMLILPKEWEGLPVENMRFIAFPNIYYGWAHKDLTKNTALYGSINKQVWVNCVDRYRNPSYDKNPELIYVGICLKYIDNIPNRSHQ